MDHAQKIMEKLKQSGGIITSKALRESNIPTIYLTRLLEDGQLIRAERGIYINSNGDYDEHYFFQMRYQVAIFSYVSALSLQHFSDIIPEKMEVTVYKGYNPHRMNGIARVHYVSKAIYNLGVTCCSTTFGNSVRVYDLERTICDLIKNKNETESELFVKTINRYGREKSKDLNKLYEYAKKMKLYDKVKNIMEIVYE